jgi:hypothetical protein
LPTQQQLVTAENVAVRGGARSAIGNVGIRLPASAPTASSIVFIDDVSMTVRRCALNGLNVPLSIGIRVSGVESSDTEITDSVIERVNQGAVINESNANFAFNVLRLIDDDAVSVAPASSKGENGTTPVFGDVNQPQQTGSNTFEDIGGAFIDNDNNEEMLAQFNDFDGLTETNEIDQSIDGNVNFSPFLKSTNFFASTVVLTVRDSQTGDLLEGAEATSVPSVGDGIEASPGIYTYTLTSGRYSFVFRKDGFQRTNVVEDVENPIENFDVLVDPEDPPAEAIHTGDQNSDSIINLSELLRIVQFYNANVHSCEQGTEDGYAPGASGSQDCGLHAADYRGPFWQVTLAELLRVIQLFNSGGYTYCPGDGEDTYCPATK